MKLRGWECSAWLGVIFAQASLLRPGFASAVRRAAAPPPLLSERSRKAEQTAARLLRRSRSDAAVAGSALLQGAPELLPAVAHAGDETYTTALGLEFSPMNSLTFCLGGLAAQYFAVRTLLFFSTGSGQALLQ
mmetsp:Transcript_106010/g.236498  ORF Transcript_106010/g.236498 Transcript_106010/m.236498 type:complete len:133 (-) Transcript_106010:189-587(-)